MNIYFINRKSKWRGPFDVIDAKQKHIISVGDVCIYDTDENFGACSIKLLFDGFYIHQ